MVNYCVCGGCTNSSSFGFRMHFFPDRKKSAALFRAWVHFVQVKRKDFTTSSVTANSMICGAHFKSGDYISSDLRAMEMGFKSRNNVRLIEDAVPSVHADSLTTSAAAPGERSTSTKKRWLLTELEADNFTLENNVGDTLKFMCPEVDSLPSRFEKTLGTLTQRFVGMLKGSADGVLDINVAAAALNISKRRIYDIIHVLEGISLTRKKSKNIVEWLGGPPNVSDELNALVKEESRLDFLIKCCTRQIQQMYENFQNHSLGYLTYEDIQMIPIFKEQTVFVIKAPPETKLEVPHPAESFQIHINSTQGPVEVFLCSDKGVDVSKRKTATAVDDGDYSYVPLPCLATDAPFSEDDANHNTRNDIISEPTQHISQVTITPSTDDPTSAQPPSEDHPNCATLTSSMKGSLDEEQSHLNPPPDEPMTDDVALSEHDQLLSDVHMADAS